MVVFFLLREFLDLFGRLNYVNGISQLLCDYDPFREKNILNINSSEILFFL